jgi:hypothetical protein
MGHIRSHGCRDLLVYCISGRCHHSATLNGDWLPDETPVRPGPAVMVGSRRIPARISALALGGALVMAMRCPVWRAL